jgi:predicted acylesterase/phospholipase RssA
MGEPRIIDLVFEGGGMKGIAFIGALRALAAYGYRHGRLLGTSVGSLFATLLAAGYSADELYDLIFDTKTGELRLTQYFKPFPSFDHAQIEASATRRLLKAVDLPFLPDGIEEGVDARLARTLMKHPSLKGAFAFIERGGTHDPEPFIEWLGELLGAKIMARPDTPSSAMTFAQFHAVTGCPLSIIAANVTNPTMLILNHVTAPDCPVVQAVRMATAVPFFFPPVVWKAEWGLYRRQELTGDFIVDGALLSNFPIELFLSQQPAVVNMMGKPDEKASVIGLLLDESIAVPGAPLAATPQWQLLLNDMPGLSLTGKLISTVIEARDKRAIEAAAEHIVRLPTMGYTPFAFDLTPGQLQPLYNAGHNAMSAHLQTHEFPSGARYVSETVQSQVDNKAMYIINNYGNLTHVDVDVGTSYGTVIGAQVAPAGEGKKGAAQ